MKSLIVSLHDFHPGSLGLIREQVAFFRELDVNRFSILVVPDFHHAGLVEDDAESMRFLEERREAGDDLVLHGFYHDRRGLESGSLFWTRLYSANEAEFFDLDDDECRTRIGRGAELWKRRGWDMAGFIAPGWLMPRRQDALLAELGFKYTTRLKEVVDVRSGRSAASQSLCYSTRSFWRRPVSLLWNRWLFGKLKGNELIRLGMHPNDLRYAGIRSQIRDLVQMALADGYRPISYSDYVSR